MLGVLRDLELWKKTVIYSRRTLGSWQGTGRIQGSEQWVKQEELRPEQLLSKKPG